MRKLLTNIINKLKKRSVALSLLFMMLVIPATVYAAWGPDRTIYDYNSTDPAVRNGSFTGPTFNSYINTPSYGDERNFVTVSQAGQAVWRDEVVADPGEEVEFRVYIHNAAHESTNGTNFDGIGVARNTKVRFYVPNEASHGIDVAGYVSADNATPRRVYDTAGVTSKSGQNVSLQYVPGSARLYNNGAFKAGTAVPDALVSDSGDGALIGWDALDGISPGCFEFDAVVIIKVKVVAPKLELKKTVSKVELPKLGDVKESITAKRGETISWRIDYKNTGNARIDDVTVRDSIPAGLTLVPGSIKIHDASRPNGQQMPDTSLSSGGSNVGSYTPEGNGIIRFRTVINNDVKECEIKNVAFARAKDVPEVKDDAKVIIEDCAPDKPVYRCDLIKAELVSGRKYKFTVNATALNGATIKQYRFNFGDNTAEVVTDKNVVEHTFPEEGTFVIKSTVDFNVDGQVKSHTAKTCETTINTKKPPVTPPVTPPTQLPVTGAGDMIGMFVATTVAAGLAHKFVWARRYL